MTDRGTLNIARSMLDHCVLSGEPFDRRSAWLDLLSEAAWKDRVVSFNRRSIEIPRGSLVRSLRTLQKRWGWDNHVKVSRFLDRLTKEGMIEQQIDGDLRVIRIVNFERFQGQNDRNTSVTPTITPDVTPAGDESPSPAMVSGHSEAGSVTANVTPLFQNRNTININNLKTRKTLAPEASKSDQAGWNFQTWYEAYPRKKSPKIAERAFEKVRKAGEISFDDLMERTRAQAREWALWPPDRKQFIPYPASWLNAGEYLNVYDQPGAQQAPVDPKAFTRAQWENCLALSRSEGRWLAAWGPPPGDHGCLVPADLLMRYSGKPGLKPPDVLGNVLQTAVHNPAQRIATSRPSY